MRKRKIKFARLATIPTDTDRLQICATRMRESVESRRVIPPEKGRGARGIAFSGAHQLAAQLAERLGIQKQAALLLRTESIGSLVPRFKHQSFEVILMQRIARLPGRTQKRQVDIPRFGIL